MSLLDRVSKLEIGPKILVFIIIAGLGYFIIDLSAGLLSRILSIFSTIGWFLKLGYVGFIAWRMFVKK